jgi:hypothetical protein
MAYPQHELIIDPTGRYASVPRENLLSSLGILPHWAIEAKNFNNSFREALVSQYAYYMGDMIGGTVDFTTGVYSFPGDKPLFPIARLTIDGINQVCYFYQHALVSVVDNDTQTAWMTRMD